MRRVVGDPTWHHSKTPWEPYLLTQAVYWYDIPFSHNTYVTGNKQMTDTSLEACDIGLTLTVGQKS